MDLYGGILGFLDRIFVLVIIIIIIITVTIIIAIITMISHRYLYYNDNRQNKIYK
jgi:hypothetical protein